MPKTNDASLEHEIGMKKRKGGMEWKEWTAQDEGWWTRNGMKGLDEMKEEVGRDLYCDLLRSSVTNGYGWTTATTSKTRRDGVDAGALGVWCGRRQQYFTVP